MSGKIIFGWSNLQFLGSPNLDPRYGTITLTKETFNFTTNQIETLEEFEITRISKETHPEYYYTGSPLESSAGEIIGMYTPKDP